MTDIRATASSFQSLADDHHHADADHKPGFFARWFMSTNHKDIGTLYLIFAIFAGIIGEQIAMRRRLVTSETNLADARAVAALREQY